THLAARRPGGGVADGLEATGVADARARAAADADLPVVTGGALVGEVLVDQAVAVVVDVVASLDQDRVGDDRRHRGGQRDRVVDQDGPAGAAGGRDGVQVGGHGGVGRREPDHVYLDPGRQQRGGRRDRIAAAALVAVGDQHHAVGAAHAARVGGADLGHLGQRRGEDAA